MKIRKTRHTDGSFSFAEEGITIVKDKEEKTDQIITEIEDESTLISFKREKTKKK